MGLHETGLQNRRPRGRRMGRTGATRVHRQCSRLLTASRPPRPFDSVPRRKGPRRVGNFTLRGDKTSDHAPCPLAISRATRGRRPHRHDLDRRTRGGSRRLAAPKVSNGSQPRSCRRRGTESLFDLGMLRIDRRPGRGQTRPRGCAICAYVGFTCLGSQAWTIVAEFQPSVLKACCVFI